MLTVLLRSWWGHERLVQAKEVRADPPSEFSPGKYRYFLDLEGGHCECIDAEYTSTIYVMNDAGKTVSTYHFTRDPSEAEPARADDASKPDEIPVAA